MLSLGRCAQLILAAIICVALSPVPAGATGTITIHHSDGTLSSYKDVDVRVLSGSLFLTSEDGDGTIVVNRAACSYQGKIIVCLPTSAALVQDGASHALDLKSGTIYMNYDDSAQPMSRSSAKLPAHSILLALSTRNGTVISVRGRIDQVIKQ